MSAIAFLRDRIVVTGIGVISPIGSDLDTFSRNVSAPTGPAHDGHPDFSGQIGDFGPLAKTTQRLIRKSLKLMNRETQLGVAAAGHAVRDSGLLDAGYESDRIGVCFGAGNVEIRKTDFVDGFDACREAFGELDLRSWGNVGLPSVDPLWILRVLPNMPACHLAIANDFRGPNNTITQAGVATNMAINEARHAILDGDADAMIVGGTGTHFLEQDEPEVPYPAEAAGAFVLERMDRAIERDAQIYGEILACSSATVIDRDHRARPRRAIEHALASALEQSGVAPERVSRINADLDLQGIADHLHRATIVSLKQRTGNAEAGSNSLEIAASLLAMQRGNDDAVAINVNALANGLASCVMIGNVAHRRAA